MHNYHFVSHTFLSFSFFFLIPYSELAFFFLLPKLSAFLLTYSLSNSLSPTISFLFFLIFPLNRISHSPISFLICFPSHFCGLFQGNFLTLSRLSFDPILACGVSPTLWFPFKVFLCFSEWASSQVCPYI